jgi:YD repeat-containing protein
MEKTRLRSLTIGSRICTKIRDSHKLSTLLFYFASSILVNAQVNLQKVIHPSPEASALGKFGDIAVSTYTGVPNVTIPLYAIEDGDITVPISLSYHAGGIRIEEEATWVGLGWSLYAGGAVTRSIRGFDDLKVIGAQTGYCHNQYLPDPLTTGMPYQKFSGPLRTHRIFINGAELADPEPYYLYRNGEVKNYRQYVGEYAIDNLQLDWESDLYYFSVNNISGKFTFDNQFKPVLTRPGKLQIEKPKTGADRWVIKDTEGFVYTFESSQTTRVDTYEYITAWFLTKIESPQGNSVDFEYYSTYDKLVKSIPSYSEISFQGVDGANCHGTGDSWSLGTSDYQVNYLKKIKFKDGYVEFLRDTEIQGSESRIDLIGAEKLMAVRVYKNGISGNSAELLKEYRFQYGYFDAAAGGSRYDQRVVSAYPEFDYDKRSKRLKLEQVTEYSSAGTAKPPHVFQYKEDVKLPLKTSFARDFWGYSNGATANSGLIPEHYGYYGSELQYLQGADRDANENYVQSGLLKSIRYPTGGHTAFTYHINEYSNFRSPQYNYVHNGYYYFDQGKSSNTGPLTLTVNKKSKVEFRFQIMGSTTYVFPNSTYYVTLKRGTTTIKTWGLENVRTDIQNSTDLYKIYMLDLEAGVYELSSNFPTDRNQLVTIRVMTQWNEIDESSPLARKNGPGVRVEKMEHFDENNKLSGIRTFQYDDNSFSSGTLMVPPTTARWYQQTSCTVLERTSSSNIALSISAGGILGYGKVTELLGSNGELGKNEYYYHNIEDQVSEVETRLPNIPAYSYSQNGNLLEKISYRYQNNTYSKVHSIKNTYSPVTTPWNVVWNMNVKKYPYTELGSYYPDAFYVAHYGIATYWDKLISTIERVYDPNNEAAFVETNKEYKYESTGHFNPTQVVTTNSTGEQITINSKYAADYTASEYGSNILFDRNMHSRVIEQTVLNDNTTTSKSVTAFRLEGNIPVVDNVQVARVNGPLETRLVVHKYDSHGNILEQSKQHDAHYAYLWGYNYHYPIAEIKNATYQQVLDALGQTAIDQLNDNPGTDDNVRQIINNLRANPILKNSKIKSFTFKPLVGMTSATDENNITTYYEYDEFGRLKSILDRHKLILKSYQYNYSH